MADVNEVVGNTEKPYEMKLVENVLNDLHDQWWDLGEEESDINISLLYNNPENRDELKQRMEELGERMLKIESIQKSIMESYFETYGIEWVYVDSYYDDE